MATVAWRDRSNLPFVGAIGLSAFLLFTLELLAGRLVLPVFGGTPGVWATTLCFFTAVLFLGYLYAHVVATRLDARRGGLLHLAVAAAVIVATFLAPREIASLRVQGLPDAVNVLLVQALIAGPAAFLLGATTPLLSAWHAGRGHDPWWLYATSNAASFAGLVAYPFLVEPLIGLAPQRALLVAGLVLFSVTVATIVVPLVREPRGSAAASQPAPVPGARVPDAPAPPGEPARLTVRRQATWLFVAFVPAGLLSATTSFITTDLLSAPLMWVGPLAVYLLSFVVAFSARGRRALRAAERLVPAAATLLWIPLVAVISWPVPALLLVELGGTLVMATAIHGRLALDRPDARQLTRFYLVLSAGGMLATAFVALLAPLVFRDIYEYPILIVAALIALALLPGARRPAWSPDPAAILRGAAERLVPYAVAVGVLAVLVALPGVARFGPVVGPAAVGAVVLAAAVRPAVLVAGTAVAIVALSVSMQGDVLVQRRTFFGVLQVTRDGDGHAEYSGTTLHGFQYLDPVKARQPTTYYVKDGPLGQIMAGVQARLPAASIGVVGLGVGTTIAYARPGDAFTFYEIDPVAVEIARDASAFTYLAEAPVTPRIVIGDARLSLAAEPAGTFDLLVLDAFSSDAVPAHLLTREAIADYARTLRPGGLLLFHVTNRYYRLDSAIISTAQSLGLAGLTRAYEATYRASVTEGAVNSVWAAVGQRDDIARLRPAGWGDPVSGPVLTDDFSDLLRTLRLGSD